MATVEQKTAPEIRAAFRARAGKAVYFPVLALHRDHVLALCDDADALAGALEEVERLRAALATIRDRANHRVEWHHLPGIIERLRQMASDALTPEA